MLIGLLRALNIVAIIGLSKTDAQAQQPDFIHFNSIFLHGGNGQNVDISRFAHGNPVLPGEYQVELQMNGKWVGRASVSFIAQPGSNIAQACVDRAVIERIGLDYASLTALARSELVKIKRAGCADLPALISGARIAFDFSSMTMDINLPQAALLRTPRGYISPEFWDVGIPSATLSYSLNSFRAVTPFSATTSNYLGLTSGLNLGSWHLRQRSAISSQADGTASAQNIATYLLHDMPAIKSRLTIGDNFTDGTMFNSVGYRGVSLASDDRMLPDSQRGYAPTVRGIARTNARVRVTQNGNVLLETTVPPGPFEINDLYPTGYGGNLQVTVFEGDGSQQSFNVPYASLVQLLRPGMWRYSATAAQMREGQISSSEQFSQVGVQYGFSNLLTGYTGAIAASNYAAVLAGLALNTPAGALALDITQNKTDIAGLSSTNGRSARFSYSKVIPQTDTNITLITSRNTSDGFWSFRDSVMARQLVSTGIDPNTFGRQRSQLQLNISQNLSAGWGNLYLSASKTEYWNQEGQAIQLQAGYNNFFVVNGINLNYGVSITRLRDDLTGITGNTILATLSFPLGTMPQAPQVSMNVISATPGSNTPQSLQTTMSGTLDEDNTIQYSATTIQTPGNNSVSAGVQYISPYSTLSATAGQGASASQQSIGASGGIVLHEGGVTFSNQLTDTIGLIEAPGAQGAKIPNAIGSRIDGNGYGVLPYLMPYRLNTIGIDPEGLPLDVEFLNTSQQVAPRADAVVLVRLATRVGRAVLFTVHRSDGAPLPFLVQAYWI